MLSGRDNHAFLWLPRSLYCLGPGLHDLNPTGQDTTAAVGLNVEGVIVGAFGSANPLQAHPAVWLPDGEACLDDADAAFTDLSGNMPAAGTGSDNSYGVVFDVSEGATPDVVGMYSYCSDGDPGTRALQVAAFRLAWGAGTATGPLATVGGLRPEVAALEIVDDASWWVGFQRGEQGVECGPDISEPGCPATTSFLDGLEWTDGSPITVTEVPFGNPPNQFYANVTRGCDVIDDVRVASGYGEYPVEGPDCQRHMNFWELSTPWSLDLTPYTELPTQGTGMRVLYDDRIQVCGFREDGGADTALLAEHDPSQDLDDGWCVHELAPHVKSCVDFTLRQSHEVNVHGYVVVWGEVDDGESGTIEALKLGDVADISEDGNVNGADLAIVIARWTYGALVNIPPICQDCGEEESFGGGSPEALEAALEVALAAVGFGSEGEFVSWAGPASGAELEAIGAIMSAVIRAEVEQ